MFSIDVENNDTDGVIGMVQPGNSYMYMGELAETFNVTNVDGVTIRDPQMGDYETYNVNLTYGGLDYVHAGNKTKAFRKEVQSFCNEIKRVAPAGSASFELAKDFMDKHYGEESK